MIYFLLYGFFVSNIYAIFIAIRNFKYLENYRFFLILLIASGLQFLYSSIRISLHLNPHIEVGILLYLLIEYSVIIHYFHYTIKQSAIKKIVTYVYFFSVAYVVYLFFFSRKSLHFSNSTLLAFEIIVLLLLSLFHFIEILDNDEIADLWRHSDFIATSAIFFYFSITCPAFLLQEQILKNFKSYSMLIEEINFVAYIIFNVTLTQAFKWKSQRT